MKKSLLSALVIASVLAFNACKKEEGPQGPKGDKGDKGDAGAPGAPGAVGPVGPAGAKGDNGATILAGTTAPTGGKDGDYYFNKTTGTLFGPKAAGAWPTTGTSLVGPKGDKGDAGEDGQDGVDGKDGASFLAGAGAPTDGIGKEGDWYFDTNTSIFYGPKGATSWATGSQLPLGSSFGARTYHLVRGFEKVTQVTKVNAQKLSEVYTDYTLLSSYKVSAEDKRRFDNYSNWHLNREMIFETIPNSGVFNRVPRGAFDFAGSGVAVPAALAPGYNITVGANFKYTNAVVAEANNTYTLLQEDIDRLSVNNGAAFTYLTYAATKPENVVVGEYLTFYQKKSLGLVEDPEKYHATYTAETNFDLNLVEPNLEKWKKEGAYVFLGYNWYSDASTGNKLQDYYGAGHNRGYIDITGRLTQYVNANIAYGENNEFNTGTGLQYGSNITGTSNIGLSPWILDMHPDTYGSNVNLGPNFGGRAINLDVTAPQHQNAVPQNGATNAWYRNGKLHVKWNINSGTPGTHTLNISPLTLTNPTNLTMEQLLQTPTWVNRSENREYYTPPRLDYTFNTTTYPIVNSATTYTWVPPFFIPGFPPIFVPGYWSTVTGATGIQNVRNNYGGQPASYFSSHKLFRLTLNVVPARIVKAAKAAGVNVNNPEALINFANNLQLQK